MDMRRIDYFRGTTLGEAQDAQRASCKRCSECANAPHDPLCEAHPFQRGDITADQLTADERRVIGEAATS